MISEDEYDVLSSMDVIKLHRGGHQVLLTRKDWDMIAPIVVKYCEFSGIRTCPHCVTELLNKAVMLLDGFDK